MTKEEEAWRVQYLANRYLEHEPIVMLQARAMDITLSACEIDHFGKSSFTRAGGRWTEMLAHVFEISGFETLCFRRRPCVCMC